MSSAINMSGAANVTGLTLGNDSILSYNNNS